ncbi:G2/mitotic-specific cyclin C13-1-like [Vicia villosa]|uniref:G2/mitotic-specific cyclin C13-1-like n=1 Tax=Vicia villosa TaxID=3911 RepID=UPI00273BFBCE|nr:G2/mitotic-specific cyclin C13-1-like [Vicia villosa]XP_058783139.1 G2/mitotic-specific cyclin C13-1-like [Vicia villosa]XP_058783140.1 G2/mitotic-specific cyclin C13-1-like [Vicia villosa]
MMEIEEKRKPAIDYIERVQRCMMTTNMREKLVDWLVEVADVYKLLPETLHLAVSYIDRFLSIQSLNTSKLQLLGISAMLIASKYEEVNPTRAVQFCQITTYELHEVLEMEARILKSLNYEMGNPNVITFLRHGFFFSYLKFEYLNFATSHSQFKYLCNYLADLSLLDYECLQFKPSTLAASVIFLAKFIIRPRVNPWTLSLHESLGYGSDDLEDCATILHDLYLSRRAASLKTVRDKYKRSKYKCVANLSSPPELPESYFEDVHAFYQCNGGANITTDDEWD